MKLHVNNIHTDRYSEILNMSQWRISYFYGFYNTYYCYEGWTMVQWNAKPKSKLPVTTHLCSFNCSTSKRNKIYEKSFCTFQTQCNTQHSGFWKWLFKFTKNCCCCVWIIALSNIFKMFTGNALHLILAHTL